MKKDFSFWLLLLDFNESYGGTYCINFFMLMFGIPIFGKRYFNTGKMLFGLEYRRNVDFSLSILFMHFILWKAEGVEYEED